MKKRGLSSENGNFIVYEVGPGVELAFVLQNAPSGDVRLIEVLVECFAAGALRLSQAASEAHNFEAASIGGIREVMLQSFTTAIVNVDQFWGKVNVRNWLFTIIVSKDRKLQRKRRIEKLLKRNQFSGPRKTSGEIRQSANDIDMYWYVLERLSKNQR